MGGKRWGGGRVGEECLHKELPIYGIDQKGVHMNETGSKGAKTLEIAGAPAVPLKADHAATRARISFMTTVTDDPAAATQPRRLPLEMLVKGKTPRNRSKVLQRLRLPRDLNVSVNVGPKGSYRLEHVRAFLERWLDPWTPAREEAKDYRLLYMDCYRAHLDQGLVNFAFSRGYIILLHYGCTTGICQVNDTDLHEKFSTIYQELETAAFTEQQREDPANITRTHQQVRSQTPRRTRARDQDGRTDLRTYVRGGGLRVIAFAAPQVLDDAATTWRTLDHMQAVKGHKYTGLSIKLDGTEDAWVTREAGMFWKKLHMSVYRDELVADIKARVASGELAWNWKSIQDLIQDPSEEDGGMGVVEAEGAELEGELPPWEGELRGEALWEESGAKEAQQEQQLADLQEAVADSLGAAASALEIVAQPGDSAVDVQEARDYVRETNLLDTVHKYASELGMRAVVWHAERRRHELEKKKRGTPDAGRNPVLDREVARAYQAEREVLRQKRQKAIVRRQKLQLAKLAAKAAKRDADRALAQRRAAKEKIAADAAERERELLKVARDVGAGECGHGAANPTNPKFLKARLDALEMLRLRAPPLPEDLERAWPRFQAWYAKVVVNTEKNALSGTRRPAP